MIKVDFYKVDKVVGSIYWDGEGFNIIGELPEGILDKPIWVADDIEDGIKDIYSHENPEGFMKNLNRHYKSAYFRASEPQRVMLEKSIKRIKGYTAHRKGKLVAVPTYQAERKEGWKDYEYMKPPAKQMEEEGTMDPTVMRAKAAAEGLDPSKEMTPEYWATIPEDLQKRIIEDLGADAKVFEGYTIGQHTKMVLKQYDTYFKDEVIILNWKIVNADIPLLGRLNFRLFLTLHDLGKAEAVRNGETKDKQYKYNAQMIDTIFDWINRGVASRKDPGQAEISEKMVEVMKALVSQDILGDYFTKKMVVEAAAARFIETARELNVSTFKFLELARIYFMCDAGAYTEDAGGIRSLDHLFKFETELKYPHMDLAPSYKAKFRELEMKTKVMEFKAGDYIQVYHGTSGKHLSGIIKQGLRIKKYRNFGGGLYEGRRGKSVFVTASSSDAAYFCNQAILHLKEKPDDNDPENIPVVIKLKIPVEYFEKKADVDTEWNASSAFMLPEVKPEWIERVATFPTEKIYGWEKDFEEAKGTVRERSEVVFSKMETLWEKLTKAIQEFKVVYLPTNLKSWNELREKIDG